MMEISDIRPTRSELIEIKKKITIAKKGHQILEMKRDGLIHEFFELLARAQDIEEKLASAYRDAEDNILLARAVVGTEQLKTAVFARKESPTVRLATKNVMGVVLPKLDFRFHPRKNASDRGYGVIDTPPLVDEVITSYEKLLEAIIEAAELETVLKKLIEEIESTKRRVNALNYRVIPDLEFSAKYISMRLQELERENIFRLKRIKNNS